MPTFFKDPAKFTAMIIYALVLVTFLSICTIAVVTTSSQEQAKTGFKVIQVAKPISFFDQTYVQHPVPPETPITPKKP